MISARGLPVVTKRRMTNRASAWAMTLPALVFSVVMIGAPLGYVLWISLHHWFLGSVGAPAFVGLGNYTQMLRDPTFWLAFRVTLEISVGALVVELVLGVYIAMLLNRQGRVIRIVRTLFLVPSVIPSVAAGMMWLFLFDPSFGFLDYVLKSAGLPTSGWLASPTMVLPSLVLVDVWQWTPFVALIVIGGLQALPQEPLEAALIDGASPFQTFRYVVLPGIKPVIWVAALLRTMDVLRIFDTIYVMTQGGPGQASTSLNIYAYQQGFQYSQMGYASALMITLLLLVAVTTWVMSIFRRRSTL